MIPSQHELPCASPETCDEATIVADRARLQAGSFQPGDRVRLAWCHGTTGDTVKLYETTMRRTEGLDTVFKVRDTKIETINNHNRTYDRVEVRLEYAQGWHAASFLKPAETVEIIGLLVSDGVRLVIAQHDQDGLTPPIEITSLDGPALRRHGSIEAMTALCIEQAIHIVADVRTTGTESVIVCESSQPAETFRDDGAPGAVVHAAPIFAKATKILDEGIDPDRIVFTCIDPEQLEEHRRSKFQGLLWGALGMASWSARKALDLEADEVVYLGVPLSSLERISPRQEITMGSKAFAGAKGPIDGVIVIGPWEKVREYRKAA
jgi:hypothetical protein